MNLKKRFLCWPSVNPQPQFSLSLDHSLRSKEWMSCQIQISYDSPQTLVLCSLLKYSEYFNREQRTLLKGKKSIKSLLKVY